MFFQETYTIIDIIYTSIDSFRSGLNVPLLVPCLNTWFVNYYTVFYQWVIGLIQRHWGGDFSRITFNKLNLFYIPEEIVDLQCSAIGRCLK